MGLAEICILSVLCLTENLRYSRTLIGSEKLFSKMSDVMGQIFQKILTRKLRVYIQSVVPISLLYLCMKDLVLLFYIYINEINISSVTFYFDFAQVIQR